MKQNHMQLILSATQILSTPNSNVTHEYYHDYDMSIRELHAYSMEIKSLLSPYRTAYLRDVIDNLHMMLSKWRDVIDAHALLGVVTKLEAKDDSTKKT